MVQRRYGAATMTMMTTTTTICHFYRTLRRLRRPGVDRRPAGRPGVVCGELGRPVPVGSHIGGDVAQRARPIDRPTDQPPPT